jgi:hypothetical protein
MGCVKLQENFGSKLRVVYCSATNASGKLVEQRRFDAWEGGALKNHPVDDFSERASIERWREEVRHYNPTTGTFTIDKTLLTLDRGYTGHEHLQSVGLIHMNDDRALKNHPVDDFSEGARLQRWHDPLLRRFLGPDNFVQDPFNTQNFNRYGYVLNSPLMYTDPSGEFLIPVLIGLFVGVIMNGINNVANGGEFWWGMGKAAVMGAVSGAISFGIGQVATSMIAAKVSAVNVALFQAGAHGFTGGLMNVANGGEFMSGFASGAVSSLVASSVGSIKGFQIKDAAGNVTGLTPVGKAAMIASGGLSGGISSVIAGGNFWDGMRQGLITAGLNHAMHGMFGGSQGQQQKQSNSKQAEILNPDGSQSMGAKSLRILSSMLSFDQDKTFLGKSLQVFSHFTWELPQQILSIFTAQFTNFIGGVESVYRYSNGAVVVNNSLMYPGTGFTLGNMITVGFSQYQTQTAYMETIQHEFGHYMQSRILGPFYLPGIAAPSVINATFSRAPDSLMDYENSFYTEGWAGKAGRRNW